MSRLNLKTLPSTYYQENSFYVNSQRINSIQECFYSLRHTSRGSLQDRVPFYMETFTYTRQRNYCSFKPVLFTLRPTSSHGPLSGTEQRPARQASLLSAASHRLEIHNSLHIQLGARKPNQQKKKKKKRGKPPKFKTATLNL